MKVLLIVHGTVQDVGYRWLVKKAAYRNNVKGSVRNMPDGSVRILAMADDESMERFEREINVDLRNGPSVMHIDKYPESSAEFPGWKDCDSFKIEK